METPVVSLYGTQSQTVNLFYEASYQGAPVKGLLQVGAISLAHPMTGAQTLLTFVEHQIATSSDLPEYLENLHALLAIIASARHVQERGNDEVIQGWINALGGLSQARDPNTNETFMVGSNYKYWWRVGNKITGTNDPTFKGGVPLEVALAFSR